MLYNIELFFAHDYYIIYYYFCLHFQGLQTTLSILELSVSFSKLLVHYSFDVVIFHQMSSSVVEQKDEQVWVCCLWAKPYPSGAASHLHSCSF